MADFRVIPSIDQLRRRAAIRDLEGRFGVAATVDALRTAAADLRRRLASGDLAVTSEDDAGAYLERAADGQLQTSFARSLQPVINATGVIVHTNLGRAPLAAPAVDRVIAVGRGYCSLEYDVSSGERGRRDVHAEAMLCRLTGAEAAVVVNNNAAATLLILAALASGREVIVSRGELVEIGGGFRVPDVMIQSGAVLREVGTTNKTRASDYAAAVSDRTALILRVHPSNFEIRGFTERPTAAELVAVGRRVQIPVAEDLGSGFLSGADSPVAFARAEPSVEAAIASGVDVCCFSGDKLLGGPQAGIIAGRTEIVDRIRRHPLMRALRVDKLTYAALEATLHEYAAGRAAETVPVRRMLITSSDELRARAERLKASLAGRREWHVEIIDGVSTVGGGSAPGVELPTVLVALERDGYTPDALDQRLRELPTAIIARIDDDRLVLDLRTVLDEQDEELVALLREV